MFTHYYKSQHVPQNVAFSITTVFRLTFHSFLSIKLTRARINGECKKVKIMIHKHLIQVVQHLSNNYRLKLICLKARGLGNQHSLENLLKSIKVLTWHFQRGKKAKINVHKHFVQNLSNFLPLLFKLQKQTLKLKRKKHT